MTKSEEEEDEYYQNESQNVNFSNEQQVAVQIEPEENQLGYLEQESSDNVPPPVIGELYKRYEGQHEEATATQDPVQAIADTAELICNKIQRVLTEEFCEDSSQS